MRRMVALTLAFASVLLISLPLAAQMRGKAAKARKNPRTPEIKGGALPLPVAQPVAQAIVDPGDLEFVVEVDPDLTLTPMEQTLYEEMADAVSAHTDVPQDRTDFHSGIVGLTATAWCGYVTDVTPIVGGHRVKVRVSPSAITGDEQIATVQSDYWEEYDVINGLASYVTFVDPEGQAGTDLLHHVH